MGDFDLDTRLEGGEGRYRASLSRDWAIWGPNGGYLAAIALRAAGAEARIPRPASFTCHFLAVARFEPVEIEVEAPQHGRRSEAFRVSMRQAGRPILEALVRTAAELPGLEHDVVQAPKVEDPDSLASIEELFPDRPRSFAFWGNLEVRPLDRLAWERPRPSRGPVFREWFRFRPRACFEDPFLEAARTLLLIDTMTWPAVAQHHVESEFIAPSLDVAAWFHRTEEATDWLLVDAASPVAASGRIGCECRVFSRAGRLLASGGSQLLCVPRPPEG